ncbi:conserved hypothetical protein (plasmid) [Gloeothece citriformis PCC 7424]|uniref:Uncharacterized protein n=1 Tax=Gloeothece citriformis (strain PCC 7424) TaxID=65393 RepID=B7KML2_GLOC7|nr:hypothetical protein [Gloeothece citriformis]ACK74034.1 conserved hypothetical protein [Gloeothece citriformis PCC 7424]
MIKRVILIGLISAIGIVIIPIRNAIASDSILDDLISQFNNIKSEWLGVANGFGGRLQAWLESQLNIDIDEDIGVLGLPDPQDIREKIEDVFTLEGKPEQADEAANNEDREITRAKAGGTLSKEGQQQQIQKLESVEQTTQYVIDTAQTAQSRTVTQEVLKDMALQNAQIASSLAVLTSETVDASTKQDIANLNLANISEAVDSQNLREQANSQGAANSLLQIGGFASAGLDYSGNP